MDNVQSEQKAFAWLRQIPGDLFKLDEKPLLGAAPEFPWNSFSQEIGQTLQLNNLSIQANQWNWIPQKDLFVGLGSDLRGIPFNVPPLPGSLWWVMSGQDIALLMKELLKKNSPEASEEIEPDFIKAFYRFLALEALNAFEKTNEDKKLSISLAREEGLPAEPCLGLDVSLTLPPYTFYGRLFLSQEFQKSWRQRNLLPNDGLMLSSPMAEKLDIIVHLEVGKVHLKPSEWQEVAPGDFLVLENCSINPDEDGGRVMLVINDVPYFRGRLKDGNLKISEHSLYHEVDTVMDQPNEHDNESSFDHSDDDFDFPDDTSDSLTPSEEEDFEIEESETTPKALPKAAVSNKPQESSSTDSAPHDKAVGRPSLNDLPLPISIEVGRIQMSIKKLLELQPGNMLELDIHPEAGVDLVVHGKRIARGELLRIGDALGVRILEL